MSSPAAFVFIPSAAYIAADCGHSVAICWRKTSADQPISSTRTTRPTHPTASMSCRGQWFCGDSASPAGAREIAGLATKTPDCGLGTNAADCGGGSDAAGGGSSTTAMSETASASDGGAS
jgi:hypothetical protein